MKVLVGILLGVIVLFSGLPACTCSLPTVELDTISTSTVQFGTMPIHVRGWGVVSRVGPHSRATVQVLCDFVRFLKAGQPASVRIAGIGTALIAKIERIGPLGPSPHTSVELSFARPLPSEIRPGESADALIESGGIENTLYMEAAALNTENADAPVFRIGPDSIATRLIVRFGVITSELVEIKSGLRKGDKVIISDMSRYVDADRIRLE